jgi:hypothetical protein
MLSKWEGNVGGKELVEKVKDRKILELFDE